MSDVTDLLDQMRRGELTLAEVAQRFRDRKWPASDRSHALSGMELYEAELHDPASPQEGSFDEVYRALDRGQLTRSQFNVLAQAAAEAGGSQEV